ncbi:hypothetical protein Pla52o_50200 [Novipirellula galeiformis]|uniref:Uncharacterized protein n=1 Tax=Novipirellula galeiformis TaxID=2528004 RepID=A0A5C6C0W3_9BACT|nr:hypothetical protein Pla52o_50200 [Novipirellula galeiformis]
MDCLVFVNLLVRLEDDLDRIPRSRSIVAQNHPEATLDVYRTAPDFMAGYFRLAAGVQSTRYRQPIAPQSPITCEIITLQVNGPKRNPCTI